MYFYKSWKNKTNFCDYVGMIACVYVWAGVNVRVCTNIYVNASMYVHAHVQPCMLLEIYAY